MARAAIEEDRRKLASESAGQWAAAIPNILGASPPKSATWDSIPSILGALDTLTNTLNHMFFPSRGGNDLGYVEAGNEARSIILGVVGGTAYLGKPRALTFELIEQDWAQSFFTLDLHKIAPSGVYYDEERRGSPPPAVIASPASGLRFGSIQPRASNERSRSRL